MSNGATFSFFFFFVLLLPFTNVECSFDQFQKESFKKVKEGHWSQIFKFWLRKGQTLLDTWHMTPIFINNNNIYVFSSHQGFYPHTIRDSVSPVCGIFGSAYFLSSIRHNDFCPSMLRPSFKLKNPPWILKRGGLISSNSKSKISLSLKWFELPVTSFYYTAQIFMGKFSTTKIFLEL